MGPRGGVDDRKFRALRDKLDRALSSSVAKIGVFGAGTGDLVRVAAAHEFGNRKAKPPVKERSWLRHTFHDQKERFAKEIGKAAKRVMEGKLTPQIALTALGMIGQAAVYRTVASGPHIPPPLEKSTIKRKKSRRPLVASERLIGAITWKVGPRGEEVVSQ